MPKATPIEDRFWLYVSKTDDCWLWTGMIRQGSGYGMIRWGRMQSAHRVSWQLRYGPIPDGMHVLHHCDVPLCVRPDHLFLGTHTENMRDAARKARFHREGVKNNAARLTEDQVQAIRSKYAAGGISQQALADQYGIGQASVSRIVRRANWDHL